MFVIGTQSRAELQRYDAKTKTYVPYLSGISAGQLDFSSDGQWVTYITYPENTLWRMRVDGSEKLQLTYPPQIAAMPRWSPDGKQIAYVGLSFGNRMRAFVISAQGGAATELLPDDKNNEDDPTWWPDGKTVIIVEYPPAGFGGSNAEYAMLRFDLKTRKASPLPGSSGLWAPRISPNGKYFAAFTVDDSKLMLLDVQTGKWAELATQKNMFYPFWKPDSTSFCYEEQVNDGPEENCVNVQSREKQRLLGLKDVSRVALSISDQAWNGVSPDGSLLIMRDTGTRELYALELELP